MTMVGADFIANVRLSEKKQSREHPHGKTLADVGQSCDRVPAKSLPWLLEQGLIRRKDATEKPRSKTAAKRE